MFILHELVSEGKFSTLQEVMRERFPTSEIGKFVGGRFVGLLPTEDEKRRYKDAASATLN